MRIVRLVRTFFQKQSGPFGPRPAQIGFRHRPVRGPTSLENAVRDDCNNYAKTAPPTIANGRVYLASFGTRNTGSGQLCVYGLLPDGAAPFPPSNVSASVGDGQVSLTWAASPDTTAYTEAVGQRCRGSGCDGTCRTRPDFKRICGPYRG